MAYQSLTDQATNNALGIPAQSNQWGNGTQNVSATDFGYPQAAAQTYSPPPSQFNFYQPSVVAPEATSAKAAPVAEPAASGTSVTGDILSSLGSVFKNAANNEVFMNALAMGASEYLKYRAQQSSDAAAMQRLQYQNAQTVAARNAEVARASAMPVLGSMVKPGVTGNQKLGTQMPAGQTGLINYNA